MSGIGYAQCWEDAQVMLEGLDVRPGDRCLSVASAGDNALALLTRAPECVIAVDISHAQLACLALRVAGFATLEHAELLELLGASHSPRRADLYQRCRRALPPEARDFWDAHPQLIAQGIATRGTFEDYFRTFRRWLLPLIHRPARFEELLAAPDSPTRERCAAALTRDWRWRLAIRLFFSRPIMRQGHGTALFHFTREPVWPQVRARLQRALPDLATNPYLQWLLLERFATALPVYLRPENFAPIRAALPRLHMHRLSYQEALSRFAPVGIQRFNLSNILEYMTPDAARQLLAQVAASGVRGGRLLYWDMVSPRTPPGAVPGLHRLDDLSARLLAHSKFCFYNALIIEEIGA